MYEMSLVLFWMFYRSLIRISGKNRFVFHELFYIVFKFKNLYEFFKLFKGLLNICFDIINEQLQNI